jgi:CRISPR-associated endoribonuclease Cas6
MPTILTLRLIPYRNGMLLEENAPAQGWFMRLLERADKEWGDMLHAPNQIRPYNLAPLYRQGEGLLWHRRLEREIQQGEEYYLRIVLMDDTRAAWLCGILPSLELPELGHVPVRLASFPIFGDETCPDVTYCSWEDLAQTPPSTNIELLFETPTAFMSKDDLLPRAEPERFWASWQRAWETFAPEALIPSEILIQKEQPEKMALALPLIRGYSLHTETTTLKRGIFIGFVGQMYLVWRKDTHESVRQTAGVLARFSTFCGTGAKTAQGMGQTRVHLS